MWFFLALWRFGKAMVAAFRDPELRSLVILTGGLLVGGAVFYHRVEGWSWVDAFYFCVISLTTVGYGDLSPATPLGKIFTMFYLLIGLGVLAGFIGIIATHNLSNPVMPPFLRRSRHDTVDEASPHTDTDQR